MFGLSKTYLALVAAGAVIIAVGTYILITTPAPEPGPAPVIEEAIEVVETPLIASSTIGRSVQRREISVTTIGTGSTTILFVGGIHGGYEWNTALLAYEMIDHFSANPSLVPENLTLAIIPNLNPDGTFLATGKNDRFTLADVSNTTTRETPVRFNANGIDLNRNFDCRWTPESTWRGEVRSAGTAPFSEPEAAALQNWILANEPVAVAFWHSIGDAVFTSECGDGVAPETEALMNTYAAASGYAPAGLWTAYQVTGDAEGWLATLGIPAVTVEFTDFNTSEFTENLAGVTAVLDAYARP